MHKYFFLIYFFLSLNLSAEIVQKFELKGNDRISKETIKVYGEITLNKDYSSLDIDKILKKLYTTNFFEDIKISLNNGILNITVKEYAIINFVDLQGEKAKKIKSYILERLQLKSKESFIESKLTTDIDIMKKLYASIGYNFANIEAKIERFDKNRINLIYFIKKGKITNIAKINFIGDKIIKDKRLRDIIASEEKKFWKVLSKNTYLNYNNIELDKRLITNYYKSLGYYDVQVLSDNAEISEDNFTNLTYTINAGNRYRINKITTNVSDVLDKKLFIALENDFTKVIGKYYSPFIVKKLLDQLDLLIANNDLQFIEHSVNEILDNENIEVKINIYEGTKQLVEKINVLGNTVTDESVIRSELLIDEGDPFNSTKIEQSVAKLKARNLFGEIKTNITNGSNKNQKIIDISVEEKPTGEISAGAGFGTTGASFSFNIVENNWLGKGRNVTTSLDVSAEAFSGGLSVTDPNYNFSGNSLTYYIKNTASDKPDSGYKNNIFSTGIGTRFEQWKNIYLSPTLSFDYDQMTSAAGASEGLKKQEGTYSDLSISYGILSDNRDRAFAPTDGYISSFSQAIPLYADSPYVKNNYSFSSYNSFSPGAIGTFKFSTSTINGLNDTDVRLSKRVSLSNNKLRGFKAGKIGPKDGNDYIGGNYAMSSNFELSLPNMLPEYTKTDVGLFLDLGNVWNVDYDSTLDDSNSIRSTAGVNTSWLSPVGPMTFVFSQNLAKASTDVEESFSFRLGTTF